MSKITRLAAFAALAAGLFLVGPRLAAAISGANFNLPVSAVITGGLRSTGGSLVNYSAVGGFGTASSGGTLTLIPGALASVKSARLNLETAHAYPTPFMPSKGHDRITFTGLPAKATIQVYTLSGRKAKYLEKNDSTDSLIWTPVNNDQGSPLASGVYLFTVTQPGFSKKQGKIMIIR